MSTLQDLLGRLTAAARRERPDMQPPTIEQFADGRRSFAEFAAQRIAHEIGRAKDARSLAFAWHLARQLAETLQLLAEHVGAAEG